MAESYEEEIMSGNEFVTRSEYLEFKRDTNNKLDSIQKETAQNSVELGKLNVTIGNLSENTKSLNSNIDSLKDFIKYSIAAVQTNLDIKVDLIDKANNEKFKRIGDNLDHKIDMYQTNSDNKLSDYGDDIDSLNDRISYYDTTNKRKTSETVKIWTTLITVTGTITVTLIEIIPKLIDKIQSIIK